jgi:putative tricarboxylic transport membrane protein
LTDAFASALAAVLDPFQLAMLGAGVIAGLVIGVIPGLSGIFGMALLVPLTYGLDPYAAIALLLGMASVTTTSDTIPAVLLGVPGTVGSVATVQDGFPLAKQGQSRRAFGAAYSASLIGGLFGALVLAVSIPVMRPMILLMKTPDFLAVSVLGLLFVSILAGAQPTKGIAVGLIGLVVSFVGIDGQTADERFTFGSFYLLDGLPLTAVFLGIFGLPELAGLLERGSVAGGADANSRASMLQGIRDTAREWRLVLQSSAIGSLLGAIPGIGLAVIDWVAYGFAMHDLKGGPEFGTGNIRGVIAPEAANNAKEGGSLIPTIAFGLPGSASMSILLGAFVVHGLVPGPRMLTTDLSVTYTMILCIGLANVFATVICLSATGILSRIATVPARALVPVALVFVTLGAFQTTRSLGDIAVLLVFGILGMIFKSMNWPRAPFALGFVLGPMIERYFFLSHQLSGYQWLQRPSIVLVLLIAVAVIIRKAKTWKRARAPDPAIPATRDFRAFSVIIGFALIVIWMCWFLPEEARLFPLVICGALLVNSLIAMGLAAARQRYVGSTQPGAISASSSEAASGTAIVAIIVAFTVVMLLAGPITATIVVVAGTMSTDKHRVLHNVALAACGSALAVYLVFDQLVAIPWPKPVLGF